tara:strand:+ start:52 stop:321 length:270 start_codon:yes stop_codon:yes gene_type:complete
MSSAPTNPGKKDGEKSTDGNYMWTGDNWIAIGAQGDAEGLKGDAQFDTAQFEDLLNRLEGSKKRQQRQRSVEGRRDIYAQGLAGMMSNF